jgi:hypothetical protein
VKFTAKEHSTQKPNPNRECTVVIEKVGNSRMGTVTFADPPEKIGPVTMTAFDRKGMTARLRKPDKSSADYEITKFLEFTDRD